MTLTGSMDTTGLNNQIAGLLGRTKKSAPDIVNQRALNVNGRAMNETKRADKNKIAADLGRTIKVSAVTKKGKIVSRRGLSALPHGKKIDAPLAALIINKKRGKKHLPGLTGNDMKKAIIKMLGARNRSVGFDASAWIPAQKDLASRLRRPFKIGRTKGIAVYGKPKGYAYPAKEGLTASATIANTAKGIDKADNGSLELAIATETEEIRKHLLDVDMKPIFDQFNQESRR